jgi:hypothetical protein
MLSIFNALLTNTFQASQPFAVIENHVVLDMALTVANLVTPPATPARIEWYMEFAATDPNAVGTVWFREVTEENNANGDLRMALAIRRFSTNGADAPLPVGAYTLDSQFERKHAFCRIQIRVAVGGADACHASVWSVLGTQLQSP